MADSSGGASIPENVSGVYPNTSDDMYTLIPENVTSVNTDSTGSSRCYTIDYDYDIVTAVICAMCFIFGILYTFFGYRFFKAVMFLTGFIFGSVLVYLICTEEKILSVAANAGIAVGAGLLCGLVTMLVQYVGLFLTGFNFGISIAIGVLIVLEQFLHPQTKWIPIGALVGTGVLFALFTLKFQKGGTILGTSVFGGLLMIACLDFFIENFLMMHYLWDRVKADISPPVCWYSWIILGCWPFCLFVGVVAQWKITGKGFNHKEVTQRRAQTVNLKRTRAKEKDKPKENTHQSRYRHLYQIRRFNGDVISQNYIQSVQNKLSPSLRNMTPVPQTDPQTELESTNTTLTQVPEV